MAALLFPLPALVTYGMLRELLAEFRVVLVHRARDEQSEAMKQRDCKTVTLLGQDTLLSYELVKNTVVFAFKPLLYAWWKVSRYLSDIFSLCVSCISICV